MRFSRSIEKNKGKGEYGIIWNKLISSVLPTFAKNILSREFIMKSDEPIDNPAPINESMRNELLSHLHQQYAENNNASFGSIASVIIALLSVIGAYGYIFVNSSIRFGNLGHLNCCNKYSIDVLLLITIASLFVLAVLFKLSIKRGAFQRLEQFIIFKIREEFHLNNDNKILPKCYTPFNKENNIEFVQYPYDIFCVTFLLTAVIIWLSTLFKLIFAFLSCCKIGVSSIIILGIYLLSIFIFRLLMRKFIKRERDKYKKRQREYLVETENINSNNKLLKKHNIEYYFWKMFN